MNGPKFSTLFSKRHSFSPFLKFEDMEKITGRS